MTSKGGDFIIPRNVFQWFYLVNQLFSYKSYISLLSLNVNLAKSGTHGNVDYTYRHQRNKIYTVSANGLLSSSIVDTRE